MIGALNRVTAGGISTLNQSLTINANNEANELVFSVIAPAGVTGGVVNVEEASDPAYLGTWSLLTTIEPVAGAESVVHYRGRFFGVRLRLATAHSGNPLTFSIFGG